MGDPMFEVPDMPQDWMPPSMALVTVSGAIKARVDGANKRLAVEEKRDARLSAGVSWAMAAVAAAEAEAEARSWAGRFRRLLIACLPVLDVVNYVPVGLIRMALGLPYSWPEEPNVWRRGAGWVS